MNLSFFVYFLNWLGISNIFPAADTNWLLTDKGEMFRKDRDDAYIIKEENNDPETFELMKTTREILKSDTDYSFGLPANIKSFHKSVLMENEFREIKSRVSKIEDKLITSADQIRKENPPSKKNEIIKQRAM